MTATPDSVRLDSLQAELNARRSIFHFAHAAISLLVATVSACVAARLFWDFGPERKVEWFGAAVLVALVLYVHGFIRWGVGRRALSRETVQFAELRALRQSLGLDDPNALLPR